MKVIATKPGYLGKLRAVDEQFDVPDGSKATWFIPASDADPEKSAKAKPKKSDEPLV